MPIMNPKLTVREFDECPEGLHQAVCVDVVDKGTKEMYGEVAKPFIQFVYEVDIDGKRYEVRPREMNNTASAKGNLMKHMCQWRGKQMTEEELAATELEKLIGVNCQLQIVHAPRDNGGVFCNIQAIVPPPKGVIKIQPSEKYVRVQDRPTRNGNGHTAPASVPDDDEVPF